MPLTIEQKNKVKRYLRIKKNPTFGILDLLESLEATKASLEEMIDIKISGEINKIKGELKQETIEAIKSALKELAPSLKGEKGDEGDSVVGSPGYTPIKGVDYFDGKDGYTPIAGKDYPDTKQIISEIRKATNKIKLPQPQDGKTPIKGIDYFTPDEINKIISETKKAINMKKITGRFDEIEKLIKELEKGQKRIGQSRIMYGGGGGIHIETPSGTKNGTNTSFTVTHKPKLMTFNGQVIFEGAGYSLSGDGLTVTLGIAPASTDTIRNIY